MTTDTQKAGLEDIVVATSSICYLDGERGVLAYRGYDIHDLAEHATFEEVCYLLWHGRLPSRAELGELQSQLAASRRLPEGVLRLMRSLPPSNAMDTLRTLVSSLSHFDPGANDMSPEGRYRTSVTLTAQVGTVVATCGAHRQPAAASSIPTRRWATRRTSSTCSPASGPSQLEARGARRRARAACRPRIQRVDVCRARRGGDAHRRALGRDRRDRRAEGPAARRREHRRDEPAARDRPGRDAIRRSKRSSARSSRGKRRFPGSAIACIAPKIPAPRTCGRCRKSCARGPGNRRWFEISQRIEQVVKAEKKLNANVDFYSATTYYALGIPVDLFTPVFAVSRISGWTAHVLEQYANNRLIRPRAEYTGPAYPQTFVPLDRR